MTDLLEELSKLIFSKFSELFSAKVQCILINKLVPALIKEVGAHKCPTTTHEGSGSRKIGPGLVQLQPSSLGGPSNWNDHSNIDDFQMMPILDGPKMGHLQSQPQPQNLSPSPFQQLGWIFPVPPSLGQSSFPLSTLSWSPSPCSHASDPAASVTEVQEPSQHWSSQKSHKSMPSIWP